MNFRARPIDSRYVRRVAYQSPTLPLDTVLDEYHELAETWLGPESLAMVKIGEGSYGSVFMLRVTQGMKKSFDPIFRSRDFHRQVGDVQSIPAHVIAMKIVLMPRGTDDRGSYSSILREMYTHWSLAFQPPKQIGNKIYDIARVIPKMYAGGYDRRARAAVFFMEFMHGHSLADILRTPFHPFIVANIEYAIVCLFLNGFIHLDFHPGNIFIDARGNVKIFDFAFAARLEPQYVHEFILYLTTHGSQAIDAFWHDIGEAYGDAAVMGRTQKYPGAPNAWYRNVSVLQQLRQYTDPYQLEYYRRLTWVPTQQDFRVFVLFKQRQLAQRRRWNDARVARRLAGMGIPLTT